MAFIAWITIFGITFVVSLSRTLGTLRRSALHVLMCVALVCSTLSANVGHIPQGGGHTVHADIDHGHAHDLIEELWWSLHGHAHDQVDHDHSPLALPRPESDKAIGMKRMAWRLPEQRFASARTKPPERPPRS
jgi:hypothetical protein